MLSFAVFARRSSIPREFGSPARGFVCAAKSAGRFPAFQCNATHPVSSAALAGSNGQEEYLVTNSRNALTCRDCGACLTDCSPLRNRLMATGGRHVEPGSPGCEACGHCYSICPHGAISAADSAAAGPTSALTVPTDGLLALFSARRSERAFAERIASFYRRLGRIVSNPVTRAIVSILMGGPSAAFLCDPDYRARFLSLIAAMIRYSTALR